PCPPLWGGYRLTFDTLEVWQGRPSRLHDRLRYTRISSGGYRLRRLPPRSRPPRHSCRSAPPGPAALTGASPSHARPPPPPCRRPGAGPPPAPCARRRTPLSASSGPLGRRWRGRPHGRFARRRTPPSASFVPFGRRWRGRPHGRFARRRTPPSASFVGGIGE